MWKTESGTAGFIIAILMTVLGGLASYAYKLLSGVSFSLRTLVLQLLVSLFAGSIMMLLGSHYGLTQEILGSACGIAGWSGATLISALEKRMYDKVEKL